MKGGLGYGVSHWNDISHLLCILENLVPTAILFFVVNMYSRVDPEH